MKTLVIVAHQDDESLSCGGLIHKRSKVGEVRVLTMFRRKYNYGIGEQYEEEQCRGFKSATKLLGVQSSKCYQFEDGEPTHTGYWVMLEKLEAEFRDFAPDEVIVPSEHDLHQNHRWLAECCRIALRPYNKGSVKRVLSAQSQDAILGEWINWFLPLTQEELEIKIDAYKCYGMEVRQHPHSRSEESVRAFHILAGARCNSYLAEPFELKFLME